MSGHDVMTMPYEERRKLVAERRALYVGKRVRFICHGHPEPDPLTSGEEGLCTMVDDIGTLLVKWDSGRSLGLVVGDLAEVIQCPPQT